MTYGPNILSSNKLTMKETRTVLHKICHRLSSFTAHFHQFRRQHNYLHSTATGFGLSFLLSHHQANTV